MANLLDWFKKRVQDVEHVAQDVGGAIVHAPQNVNQATQGIQRGAQNFIQHPHLSPPPIPNFHLPTPNQIGNSFVQAQANSPVGLLGRLAAGESQFIQQRLPGVIQKLPTPLQPAANFANQQIINPSLQTNQRVGSLAAGKNTYAPGKQGIGQAIGDIANIASVIPGVGVATKGGVITRSLKSAAATAPIGVAASVGQDLQNGRKVDLKNAALSGAITGAIGGAGPVVGKAASSVASSMRPKSVPTNSLKIGSDSFGKVDKTQVSKYLKDIKGGKKLEPIVTRNVDGKLYIQDGKHRLIAARQAGLKNIPIIDQTQYLANQRGSIPLGKAPKFEDFGIKTIRNNNDFMKAINAVSTRSGVSKQEARTTVQGMLENARIKSVQGIPAAPAPRIAITGNVTRNPQVKNLLTGVGNTRNAASTEESLVASQLQTKSKQLGVRLDHGFIERYQTGSLNPGKEQQLAQFVKKITDRLYREQQKIAPDIPYRSNYVPQTYSQPEQAVAEATKRLNTTTKSTLPRSFNTYAEARQFGLTPKYQTLDQMLGSNAREVRSAVGNKSVIKQGLDQGIFDTSPANGRTPIQGFFDSQGNQIYSQKQVADTFNGVMQRDTTGLAKTLRTGAKIAQTQQDIALQGGIPLTDLNFFTFGQGVRDTTRNIGTVLSGHPIRAIKQQTNLASDFIRSNSRIATQERFAENADFVREMSSRGVPLNIESSLNDVGSNLVGKGWNKLGNNPTFGRYLPNRLLSTSQEVFKQASKKMPREQALNLAASTTKNFAGIIDHVAKGRSNLTQDAISVGLFAPRYREAIVNSLWNTIKSISPNKWTDKSYAANRQLFLGMAATLIAYDELNKKLNGHGMLQNRKGQELSLQIPNGPKDAKGNQPVINVPFMPGYTTIPRAIFGAASALARGDAQGVVAESSKLASMPIQTIGRVVGNQDYFGRPIYNSQKVADEQGINPDNPITAISKVAGYTVGQNVPAWARAVLDSTTGKPVVQNIATAVEAPLRFGNIPNPDTAKYFDNRDSFYKGLNKNERTVFDSVEPPKKDITGKNIAPGKTTISTAANYDQLLSHPDFLNKYQSYKKSAASHDPLWDLPPDQLRAYMQAQVISKNDPGGDSNTVRQLYDRLPQDFFTKREQYFAGLKNQGVNIPQQTSRKPQMPNDLVKFSEMYHNLPYGTGVRSTALRSPQGQAYIAYLDQNRVYNNQERADLGLPPLENSSGGSSFGRGGTARVKKVKVGSFKIAKAKNISLPKGVKVKRVAVKKARTRKLSVSKMPKIS